MGTDKELFYIPIFLLLQGMQDLLSNNLDVWEEVRENLIKYWVPALLLLGTV